MRPDARHPDRRDAAQPVQRIAHVDRQDAPATQARLDLDMDVERRPGGHPAGHDRIDERVQERARAGCHGDPPRRGVRDERRRHGIQDDDRRSHAAVPQLERLIDGRDTQPVRARALQGQGHRDRTVAVRVGLDDGVDTDPGADRVADRAMVAGECVEVDLQPRGTGQRR